MLHTMRTLLAALAVALLPAAALAQTSIEVQYPYGFIFDEVFKEIKAGFETQNPDVEVVYRPAYKSYEDGGQTGLRQAITNQLPDVGFQAINLQRLFVDRGLAVSLDPFIAKEPDWEGEGFSPAMMSLGKFAGQQYGLSFAVSTPIIYINEDLVRKAGGDPDSFPQDWDGIFDLARRIDALGDDTVGFFHSWAITGNWMWQALVLANGGTMLTADETKVGFDGPAGQGAMDLLGRMLKEAAMPNLAHEAARTTFFAGQMGIWTESTSLLRVADEGVGGKFAWRTALFPITDANGKLPTGGNAALMFASDPDKQAAAWKFMKYATGPIGATMMVKGTGYMPPNSVPAGDPELLKPFYETHPNHLTSLKQQPLMEPWYAFPGDNSLKIIDVIKNHLQSVVDGSTEPKAALAAMAGDVQGLLPK